MTYYYLLSYAQMYAYSIEAGTREEAEEIILYLHGIEPVDIWN